MRRSSHAVRRHRFYPGLILSTVLALCLGVAGAATAASTGTSGTGQDQSSTALWPRFSTPSTIYVADTTGISSTDLLTLTTLEGVYNAQQRSSRLYLIQRSEDQAWLAELPRGIHVVTITPAGQTSLVQTLLTRFRSAVRGAIITDPSNVDTVNLATTMAGLDQAVAIDPSQESMVASLGIRTLYSFDTAEFTADTVVQTYQWGIQNLLPKTSTRLLVMLSGGETGDIRDYAVATKSFVFWLTSTKADQQAVFGTILGHTPHNTPIMGYIPNEGPDVAYLSSQGHFLNASDQLTNETVWASMPSPGSLRQPSEPAPIAAQPNTVYVALEVSDGDNVQYMQHSMYGVWQDPNLGAMPEGWTVAPAAVNFAPTMLQYYMSRLSSDSELVSGPSGIGYVTQMSGPDLTQFGQLTNQIMTRDDLHTVDNFEGAGYLAEYAADSGVPSISSEFPVFEQQAGSSVIMGQTSGYISNAQQMFCTIYQQSASHPQNQPLFLEPLVDGWKITPTDVLHIAQQLALAAKASGLHYVFTTPSELAQTMQRYYAGQESGLPHGNVQSRTGEQALAKPLINGTYPTGPVTITGSNLVTNPSGASGTTGWTTSGGTLSATTDGGQPVLHYSSTITNGASWARYYPAVQDGDTYTFSVDVAGSGQVYLDVFANGDSNTLPVRLTSSYQHLTWTVTVPNGSPGGQTGSAPQLQVRSSGVGPVSVNFRNASVAASTAPC